MNSFSEDLKKIMLAGVGAVATTAEKSKDVIDQLVKKGELTIEQGKVLNEELKHDIKEKFRTPANADEISKDLEKLSKEELDAIKAKIEELEKGNE
ncbi:phasin family protein [Amedibacillus sp. YH-ame10]